jgi:hypothetical protein
MGTASSAMSWPLRFGEEAKLEVNADGTRCKFAMLHLFQNK